jgi:hypothetical protein
MSPRVKYLTGLLDVEADACLTPRSQPHRPELRRVRVHEARMYTEPIGELTRVNEGERRRTLATQELDGTASHGLYIFGAQRHGYTKLAK